MISNQFGGITFHANEMLLEFEHVPVRKHKRKNWMRKSYHERIQKKWSKRFGYTKERRFYRMDNRIDAHPKNIEILKKEFSKTN